MSVDNLIKYELPLWQGGMDYIAGVDEVGRGSLAGPMVVCAAIINKEQLFRINELDLDKFPYHEIKDSKKLTANKRHYISAFLHNELLSYSLVEINNQKIDELGIVACTQLAFSKAIKKLELKPQHVFTDNYEIKDLARQSQTNLVRGDNKSITVAAASIVAKVYRDNLMVELHRNHDKYQVYQFHKHKGYGTKLHREMIKKHGHSDIHRKTFRVS